MRSSPLNETRQRFLKQIIVRLLLSSLLIFQNQLLSAKNYQHVDNYVLSLPQSYSSDLLRLTHKLVQPFNKPDEKIRAIYRWITENIDYDIQAYMNGSYGSIEPKEILRTGKGMCGGYAFLFKEMAETAGVEAEVVAGYSKGYGYEIGSLFTNRSRHSWNAIKIEGEWHLLDATWGAGYIDDEDRFVDYFNEYYFLTPPDRFIQSHFPDNPRWQLLQDKKTRKEFEESAYTKPAFFYYGLKIVDHPRYKISAKGSLRVRIFAPRDIQLVAQLLTGKTELDESLTFTQRKDEIFEINAVFPWSYKYILRIFTKPETESGPYEWVLDYNVDARKGSGTLGFPQKYGAFEKYNAYLYHPLNESLKAGSKVHFKLRLDAAENIGVIHNDFVIAELNENQGFFEGNVEIPEGEFFLIAKFSGSNSLPYLLRFEGSR